MIYYEKKGKWPLLRAKKQVATSDSEEDYVPKPSDFGVMADGEMKNGITGFVLEPAPPMTPTLELQASQV
jgi:hypothetical protein